MFANKLNRLDIWEATDKQYFFENIIGQWPKECGNEWVFCCPYHDDKTPSLYLNNVNGLFNCKACNASGDFIQLTMDKLNIKFREALELLAPSITKTSKQITVSWNDIARYHKNLVSNNAYIELVRNYGINLDTIKRFKLGIRIDKDCKRLVIPINKGKELVCVKFHRITGNPFHKTFMATGSSAFLYPYNLLIESNNILLLEGEPDVLAAYSAGIDKFVTPVTNTNGCNVFKFEWCYEYFNKKTVYMCYDNDTAGSEATIKILNKLYGSANIYMVNLPAKDLREYLKQHSADDFKKLLKQSTRYNERHILFIKYKLYEKLKKLCRSDYEYKGFIAEIDDLFRY